MKIVSAVGLLLFNFSGELLLLRELEGKKDYCKLAGMLSFPIETIKEDKGETPDEAMDRLIIEEIGVPIPAKPPWFYRRFEIVLNSRFTEWLYAYICVCENSFDAHPTDTDISYYKWMLPREFLNLPNLPEPFREQIRVEMEPVLWYYLAH